MTIFIYYYTSQFFHIYYHYGIRSQKTIPFLVFGT